MFDITVVGAGPVGLYAAYYAGLRECRTKLIETYPQVGGRLISMYPEKEIFDVAGHRSIVAAELVQELTAQAMQYKPTVVLNERVTGLRILGERVIELTTPAGVHYTQTAILTVGCGAFVPRKLDIPNLIDFEGHGIYYFLPSFEPLRGKKVLIVGGGTARWTGRSPSTESPPRSLFATGCTSGTPTRRWSTASSPPTCA